MEDLRKKLNITQVSVDLLGAVALFAVSAVFLLGAGEGLRDWLFPRSLASTLMVVGVVLAASGLRGQGPRTAPRPLRVDPRRIDVAVFLGLAVVYVVLTPYAGFWAMSAVMLFAASVYLGDDRRVGTLLRSAAIVVVVCVLAYVLFVKVFFVPLPTANWLG